MTTTIIKSAQRSDLAAPSLVATEAEAAIFAISGLRGWWDASHGIQPGNGWRWRDRISARSAAVLEISSPLLVTASHGRPALQTGVGRPAFSGTNRGASRPQSEHALLGLDGCTVFSVTRVPTVASGESATLGGNVWSSRGAASASTPGLNISGSTGAPVFRAGGATISNPGGFDARDGAWHVMRCTWDRLAGVISTRIDRSRAVGSNTGASAALDPAVPNMQAPLFGAFLNTSGVLSSPFYGQTSALMFFNAPLSDGNAATVENYLAARFGLTLV
jgi:hypothetical protein